MKKQLLLLLLFVSTIAFAQTTTTPVGSIRHNNELVPNLTANTILVRNSTSKMIEGIAKPDLIAQIIASIPRATATVPGTVRTTTAETNPEVYTVAIANNLLNAKVDKTTTVNGQALSSNITIPVGTVNSTDAQLRDRATHTGVQLSSTISDIQSTITNNTAVLANTAKAGITTAQSNAIVDNTAKIGITTAQANAIVANTAKVSNATHIGDATGSTTLTLATVNSNIGSFGNSTTVPTVTVNAKGLVTAASATAIPTATTSVTGLLTSTDFNAFNAKISGTGTTNFIPKFTASGTVGPSSIFDNGNVGIGTTSPTRKLTIDSGSNYINTFFKAGFFLNSEYYSSILIGYQDNQIYQSTQFGYVYNTVSPLLSYGHITVFGQTEGSQYKFLANGNFGINQPAPTERLDVVGNGKFSGIVTATSFFQSSDRRLKNIIKRDGNVIYYTWKDNRDSKTHIGYIAQEVRKTNPDQVNKDEQGFLSVNYIEILVEKIRNLEKEIELLKAK